MKLQDCRQGRHGACDGVETFTRYDENANVTFEDEYFCECWCHVIPKPEPGPEETSYVP